jgi:hypothetical protein
MRIISAEERLKQQTGVKMAIFGPFGIGKTSLLKTLNEPTLCLDFEAGLLAVQDWSGDSITARTWPEARDIACIIGGPNPAVDATKCYSQRHYDSVRAKYNNCNFEKYKCIFIDSITMVSKVCLAWARTQIESNKSGKSDSWAAYALLANEMLGWITHLQHTPDKDVIVVGLLEQKIDDFNRTTWLPQIEGSKTAAELPAIFDEVITMIPVKKENGEFERKFVCQTLNPNGYPAKDRSGRLNITEEAHLGKLLNKIKTKQGI